ncbi:Adenosine 5'-monophosphoramidase [Polyrhizophydium stewartii]|uniref:Adenosine 5'-monophosphoramidase n=1 Tax=Polyrhizophydium stewartii TaxID=2732419 RepID=A0ABR4N4M3_9FUNG
MSANCIFCKIIKGQIPSHKLLETDLVYAFLDISPVSKGHVDHAQFLHQVPDESLAALLPAAKKIAAALGAENYNILQNNGRIAHQAVDHVHVHVIPKTETSGLGIVWPNTSPSQDELTRIATEIKDKVAHL